ncbi:hypothetical protein EVAR_31361_1 [Eumeta japonica]|uniref:Uncharacterized protein n=1 Tax=Eumeta variegata TaxID=151549 RepID=A0A4C1XAJ1_EUMVA|nr:hypothetical protein EVAR_31361_1 [Eumeta japonica]
MLWPTWWQHEEGSTLQVKYHTLTKYRHEIAASAITLDSSVENKAEVEKDLGKSDCYRKCDYSEKQASVDTGRRVFRIVFIPSLKGLWLESTADGLPLNL